MITDFFCLHIPSSHRRFPFPLPTLTHALIYIIHFLLQSPEGIGHRKPDFPFQLQLGDDSIYITSQVSGSTTLIPHLRDQF